MRSQLKKKSDHLSPRASQIMCAASVNHRDSCVREYLENKLCTG